MKGRHRLAARSSGSSGSRSPAWRTSRWCTTQALALFDMRESAGTANLQDIVDRQNDAGGIDLLSAKKTPPWRHDGEVARGRLVRRFYEYAKRHPRGEGETWSSWSARNP